MSNIPTGVIFIWSGTNATIPSGWERETALDGKYPKGTANATDPNDTGGSATHTHNAGATHTHAMDAHLHSVSLSANVGGDTTGANSGSSIVTAGHAHGTWNSGAVVSASIDNIASTYSAVSNHPPYHDVIFIKPSIPKGELPSNAIALYDNATMPTGFVFCDGTNSTPDLRNKYLRGAGTGENAGGTGGSVTNVHNLTHTHAVSHAHASVASNSVAAGAATKGSGGWVVSHTHSASLNASTTGTSDTPSLTTTETVEPAYTKLNPIQNNSGIAKVAKGLIGLWLGSLANIPSNYLLCDGTGGTVDMRGKYLKSSNVTSEADDTGGANTHTHAAQGHTHTVSHTHTANPASFTHGSGGQNADDGGAVTAQDQGGSHATTTVSTLDYALASTNTTGASSSNEPEYRTVAYIKLASLEVGGAFLLTYLNMGGI